LEFEQHLRQYVRTILDHPGLEEVRIVLISPPPANIKPPRELSFPFPGSTEIQRNIVLNSRAHQSWLEKRKYAEKVVQVGEEFEDETMRVAVIDLWQALVRWACCGDGNESPGDFDELDEIDMLPGCGLPNAKQFGTEIFKDNLHLGPKVFMTHMIKYRIFELIGAIGS
jgi:isoamyl acetate esterase